MLTLEEEMLSIKESILEQLMIEGVDDPGILKCVFMAGGPGSGKSYTAKELFGVGKKTIASVSSGGLKLVNSDTAFEKGLKDNGIDMKQLGNIEKNDPELWNIISGDGNKNSIRAQAKKITKQQQDFYEAGRLGMVIDGTGDKVDKIKEKVKSMMKNGDKKVSLKDETSHVGEMIVAGTKFITTDYVKQLADATKEGFAGV